MAEIPPVRPRPTDLARVFVRAPVLLYRLGLGGLIAKHTLLLTTTGRRSGVPRVVPLDYQREGDTFYLIAEGGGRSPWYRNLVANPEVEARVGSRRMKGVATPLTDATSEEGLLALAPQRAIVALRQRE